MIGALTKNAKHAGQIRISPFIFYISDISTMKILKLLFCGLVYAEDYKNHYIEQPLRVLFGNKMPHFPESNWIERNNLAWIDRNDDAKEKVS